MKLIQTKSGDKFEFHAVTEDDYRKWFEDHTDDEGNVTDEIIVYTEAEVTKAEDGSYDWTLSDYSVDRDNERIDPEGWDVKNFKGNPIMLWQHDTSIPAIGTVEGIRKSKAEGALLGKPQFDMDDPFAAMLANKVAKGILTKGSVGFRSLQVEISDNDKEKADLIHRKQELYEFSIVNIPSNVNASVRRDAPKALSELPMVGEPFDNPDYTKLDEPTIDDVDLNTEESYLDLLFAEDRETSDPTSRETSDLFDEPENQRFEFDEDAETDTIEDLLSGGA